MMLWYQYPFKIGWLSVIKHAKPLNLERGKKATHKKIFQHNFLLTMISILLHFVPLRYH